MRKYKLYLGNEELKLTKNEYKELLKWREIQIRKELEKQLDNINNTPAKKGTLDS